MISQTCPGCHLKSPVLLHVLYCKIQLVQRYKSNCAYVSSFTALALIAHYSRSGKIALPGLHGNRYFFCQICISFVSVKGNVPALT